MANKPLDTRLLDRAIKFAVDAHAGTERRGKGFPYIVHPMEAMEIVASITPDQELLAAAVLHDTVEDTGVSVEDIRKEFGERIAGLVEAESDKFTEGVSEEDSWHDRKQAAIDRLAGAPYDAKIVAMGDKLSNMRAIYRDYLQKGDELWKIFHAKDVKDHEWHYHGLACSLSELADTEAYKEFVRLYKRVFDRESSDLTPEKIDLADYTESGAGFTAISYNHSDGKTMVKLYAPFIPAHVPGKERANALRMEKLGIVTPPVGRIVTDGQRTGVEFVRINPKKSFSRIMCDDPSRIDEMAGRFAKMCLELHSLPCDTVYFENVKDFFGGVIERDRFFSTEQKARFKAFVDSVPAAQTCVHGDLHFGNVITDGTTDWWIDLADFRYGHPYFDLGMLHLSCIIMPDDMALDIFHLNRPQREAFWASFVKYYFPGETLEEVNAKIAPFSALLLIHHGNRSGMDEFMRAHIENTLLK